MLNILLIIQIVISILLVTVILIQRTGSDSLSGLSGGGNTGAMSARSAANFLTYTTVILAMLFLLNSILLANLSSKVASNAGVLDPVISIEKTDQAPSAK
ncbi:MAG: preprotein translocase subunit SecG [Alphaproteobacteria bacterium]|nr:preprotein translocase subunit SecG [Alphaproteobacteria bacterium]